MSLMLAIKVHVVALCRDCSQSFANLRQRPCQAKVRSTTHRRASTSKPLAVSDRLMISMVQSPWPRSADFEFVTRIATIGEDVAQPGEAMADGPEDVRGAVAILDPGGMDDGEQQQAQRIGHDVALAPLDLLARIEARNPAALGGFDALAIDHARRWTGLAAFQFPRAHHQQVVDALPKAGCRAMRRNNLEPWRPAESPSAACATGSRSKRCRGSHPSPHEDQWFGDGLHVWPPATLARLRPIRARSNRLDSAGCPAYAQGERYHSMASGPSIFSTKTENHKSLISLNFFGHV